MSRDPRIRLDRLGPIHAPAISRIERSVYPAGYIAGAREVERELRVAERDGENLSIGLFDRERLVGFVLAYYQPDRREVFRIFHVAEPEGLALEGDSAYIADFVVLDDYRAFVWELFSCLAFQLRAFCPDRPVDAFSVESALERWKTLGRTARRLGFELRRQQRVEDGTLEEPLYWLSFEPVPFSARPARSEQVFERGGRRFEVELLRGRAWGGVAAHWDRLVDETPDATAFASLEALSTWFELFGLFGQLYVVSIREGNRVVCVAPLHVSHRRIGGRHYKTLGFVGDPRELDRPNVLGAPDPEVARVLARFLVSQRSRSPAHVQLTPESEWDVLYLYEQCPTSVWLGAIRAELERAGLAVFEAKGPDCPYTEISGTWTDYLRSRSRAARRSLARKARRIEAAGKVELESVCAWPDVADALAAYADVEARSWKPSAGLGVRKTPLHWVFYRRLVERLGPQGAVHASLLKIDDVAVAATFGIAKARRFASLHIAHDRAFDRLSPGVVITARELEGLFTSGRFSEVDYLGGYLTNKLSWASGVRPTVTVYAYVPTPRLRAVFAWCRVEPAVKRALQRMGALERARTVRDTLVRGGGWLATRLRRLHR